MTVRRAAVVSVASFALAAAAACSHCGNPADQADSSTLDASDAHLDTLDVGDATSGDGAVINDWPGWRRQPQLDSTCRTDVPVDPATAIPKLVWKPCATGRPQCDEIDLSQIPHPTAGSIFTQVRVGPNTPFLAIQRLTDEKDVAEWDVYTRATFEPLIAWRFDEAATVACGIGPTPTTDQLVVYASFYGTANTVPATAIGTPAQLLTSPSFVHWSPDPQARPQVVAASNTTFAGDLGVAGAVLRLPPATAAYTKTTPAGLSTPVVYNDDVFAWNEHGNNLWAEEVVVKPDGSTYVLRAATGKNVTGFIADGTWLYWLETSGTTDPDQTTNLSIDVFVAPYTADASTLASSAKKLATFANAAIGNPITFNGIYAWAAPGALRTYVVRTDGNSTMVLSDGTNYSQIPVYVSNAEYWSIESKLPNGPTGIALTRIKLGIW